MSTRNRVNPLPYPKYKPKDFSVPKPDGVPQELTEEELVEQEKNLERLWNHVHGHKAKTEPPKKRK